MNNFPWWSPTVEYTHQIKQNVGTETELLLNVDEFNASVSVNTSV